MIETRFKQTEIGLIPEAWELRRIDSAFDFVRNNTLSRESMSSTGEVINIHYGDVLVKYGANVDVSSDDVVYINASIRAKANHALKNGDVVVADTAEDEIVGKCCEIIGADSRQVEAGLHTFVLRPKDKYATKFLGYAFNAACYHDQLIPHMQGTKVISISKGAIGKTFLLCPPLVEQERIAKALSDVDTLISDLDALIAKKRDIKQGVIQQLVSGAKRLGKFDGPWRECKLGEALNYEQPTAYIVSDTEYIEHGIPVLTAGKSFVLGYTAEKIGIYDKGDVIIFDDFTTDSKYVSFPFKAKSSAMKMLTANEGYDLRFMYELLSMIDYKPSDHMRHWIGMFSKLSVSIPSYEEQVAISKILKSMDDDIATLEEKKAKYEAIKQGMMQELLTGKIRLV